MVGEKGFYGAGMTDFDDSIGALVKKLKDLGVYDNTIIVVTTDNGAEVFSWPDGGTTPFVARRPRPGRWLPRAGRGALAGGR